MGAKVKNAYLALWIHIRQKKEEEASRNNAEKQTLVPTIIPPIPQDVFEGLNKLRKIHDE